MVADSHFGQDCTNRRGSLCPGWTFVARRSPATGIMTEFVRIGARDVVGEAILGMLIKIGIARVTQLLKPELELSTRMEKLASRLTFGVASAAADLARVCGDSAWCPNRLRGHLRWLAFETMASFPTISGHFRIDSSGLGRAKDHHPNGGDDDAYCPAR